MLRLAFLLVVAVLTALFVLQASQDPGEVRIVWFGWILETSALFGVIALTLFTAILLPILRMLMFLIDAPGRIGRASERAKRRRGQEALAMGLIAAEAGEFEEARKQADRASDMVEEPRLSALLEARAAEVAGDTAAAERAYSGMLQNEETEILGRKGLLAAALKRGDRTSALSHAEAALRLSKTSTWPFQSAFELKVQFADWEGAIDVLEQGEKRKLLDKRAADRRRAVLLTAAATRAERERKLDKAADMALKATKLAPAFAPAAAMAARLLIADGKPAKAQDVLEDAWIEGPHPAIAHAYRDLVIDETPVQQAERMMVLVDKRRDHRESRIIAAGAAMAKGEWALAQAALDDAYRESPSARICALMAQVARGRGDEAQAAHYMAMAATAPREFDWSDLDPEGTAFLYEDADWARMVYLFGDGGQLVHPRADRPGGARDSVYLPPLALPAAPAAEPAPAPTGDPAPTADPVEPIYPGGQSAQT